MTSTIDHCSVPLFSLDIPPGPLAGVLASARDRLCEAAFAAGVRLMVNSDMTQLLEVNAAAVAAGSWEPLLPAANATCRALTPGNAYWIQGVNGEGETVTVQAGLLFDCAERSIGQRFADLTVSYDHPATQAPEDEWCTVSSDVALGLHGQVVWTNAGWTRPDWRRGKRGLFATAQRANKLVGWTRWQPDAFISVVEPHILPSWSERNMGHSHIDAHPGIVYHQHGLGDIPMHFVLFTRGHFFGDLASLVVGDAALAA